MQVMNIVNMNMKKNKKKSNSYGNNRWETIYYVLLKKNIENDLSNTYI